MTTQSGYNKKIEPVRCLEKYTSDRKVKRYLFNVFLKLCVDAKIDDLPAPLGVRWRQL